MIEPDGELIVRAASGDSDAFTQVFERYHPVVYRFARVMTDCPAAAEDISQDAFVAVLCNLQHYDRRRATFTTYLYGIVRNLHRERQRRERRFLPLDVIGAAGAHAAYFDDPAAALADGQLAADVRRAIQRLPPRYRELVMLCDVHAVSYANAATLVGTSSSTVRTRLVRARQLLRRQLSAAS